MIIKKPTYEDMIPFLGRTATIADIRSGKTKTGCLVSVVARGDTVYAALEVGAHSAADYSGRIDANMLCKDKAKSIGPQDVIAFYCPDPPEIKIHEPSTSINILRKWWLLAVPVALRLLK